MTASLHVAAGVAAGAVVQEYLFPDVGLAGRVFWAFVAGIVSHIILDVFPHQEYALRGLGLWVLVLAEAGLILALVLSPHISYGGLTSAGLVLFSAMVGGALPDFLEMSYDYFFRWEWIANLSGFLHLYSHNAIPLPFKINFWWQSLLAALLVLFARFKSV